MFKESEITEKLFNELVLLNKKRMNNKGKISGLDDISKNKISMCAKVYGRCFCLFDADDNLMAGTLCQKIGNNYFLHIIAHDPKYDDINIGQVILFQTINSIIEDGAISLHMLWGKAEYKTRFGGIENTLYDFYICKNMLIKFFVVLTFYFNKYFNYFKKVINFLYSKV